MASDDKEMDDFIDGMWTEGPTEGVDTVEFDRPNLSDLPEPLPEPPRSITNWALIRRLAWIGLGVLVGLLLATTARVGHSPTRPAATPGPTVTVTTTPTQPALPASCTRALDLMRRVMADTSTIGGAANEQLDISHAARQAMFVKDWKALDETMNRQKELNDRLNEAAIGAMQLYPQLQEAIRKCEQDAT